MNVWSLPLELVTSPSVSDGFFFPKENKKYFYCIWLLHSCGTELTKQIDINKKNIYSSRYEAVLI